MKALSFLLPFLIVAACAKPNANVTSNVASAATPVVADPNSDYVAVIVIDGNDKITARLQKGTAADAQAIETFESCARDHGTHGMDPAIGWQSCSTDAFDIELDNPWAGKGYTATVTPKRPAGLGYILGNCDEVYFTGLENQGSERYEFTCKFTGRQKPFHHGGIVAAPVQ